MDENRFAHQKFFENYNFSYGQTDFRGENLSGIGLNHRYLKEFNFSRAKLKQAYLVETNLQDADLSEADLRSTRLDGADLRGVKLVKANLSQAVLNRAKLTDARINFAILKEASLKSADLRFASLYEVNLNKACFIEADLRYANFTNANLSEADLRNANIIGADFSGAKLDRAKLPDGIAFDSYGIAVPINGLNSFKNSVNNQGIPISLDRPLYTWERLRFRSNVEIKIAQALERSGVIFWPNCLARLNDPKKIKGRANKEADFLICWQGKLGILEVDGPYHTATTLFEEQERDRLFRHHGIRVVERFGVSRCNNQPDEVVSEFLRLLAKMY